MKKTLSDTRLIYVALVFASVLGPISGNSRFWVNDDVGNMLVLSGGFTGTPDFKVYAMGPITGLLISALYRMTTSLPWYPILLIVAPLLAALFLLKDLRRLVPKFAFFGFSLFLVFPMFLIGSMINYTFSSFVGCSLAITLLMIRISKEGLNLQTLILPLVLITVSSGFRASWPTGFFGFPPPGFAFASIIGVISFILLGRCAKNVMLLVGLLFSVYLVTLIPQHVVLRVDRHWSDYISYSEARGNLNGTETFTSLYRRAEADDLFLGDVKTKTGIDFFGLNEIGSFQPYDATSVSTEGLIALHKVALTEYSNEFGFISKTKSIVKEGFNFVTFEPFALCFLLAVLIVNVWFLNKDQLKKIFAQCFLIVLCSALLVGFVLADKRTPNYVVAGCLFGLALTLLMLLIFENNYLMLLAKSNLLAKITFVTLMTFGSIQTFSGFLAFPSSQDLTNSEISRAKIRDSSRFLTPIIHNLMTVGYAYENIPFDTSIPREYFESKDFSGGSFLRSPQSLERWNRITGESQSFESLFSSEIYERVLLEPWFAESISNMISKYRGKCLTKISTEYKNFVRLRNTKTDFCKIRLTQSGTNKSISDVFSGLSGFDIEIVGPEISELEILLISPFGEFAKIHRASVFYYEIASGDYSELEITVDPAIENRIVLNDLKLGDRIEIVSKSPCVIPFELDASRFLDRTEKCVGVESIFLNGQRAWTKDLIGS